MEGERERGGGREGNEQRQGDGEGEKGSELRK